MIGGFFRTKKRLPEADADALRKKWEDAYTGPVARGFGIGELGPEIMWIDVTTIDSSAPRYIAGGVTTINEARGHQAPAGKCSSCGSRQFVQHHGRSVCTYCRSAA